MWLQFKDDLKMGSWN